MGRLNWLASYLPARSHSQPTRTWSETHSVGVIEHSAYPHIVDKILAEADHSVLNAFRATSHQYHDIVDARQVYHVQLFAPSRDDEPICITTPKGLRIPSLMPRRCGIHSRTQDDGDNPQLEKRHISILSNVRILDMHGSLLRGPKATMPVQPKSLRGLASALEHVRIRRIRTQSAQPFDRLHTPCPFQVASRAADHTLIVLGAIEPNVAQNPLGLHHVIPGTHRHVVHLLYDSKNAVPVAGVGCRRDYIDLAELVVICSQRGGDNSKEGIPAAGRVTLFAGLYRHVARLSRPTNYTLVGVTQSPEQEAEFLAEARAIVDVEAPKLYPGWSDEQLEKALRDSVRFVTRQQYREEVGEVQWALETKDPDEKEVKPPGGWRW